MRSRKEIIFITFILILCLFLSGCKSGNNVKVFFGLKNKDFEYIKNNKIEKIVIQNTRDKGFRFVITDDVAIKELYNILSSAKPVKKKTSLKPDYIFEMHEGPNKIHKFNYVAGLSKKDKGNLYSNDKIYYVSKRIDNDIIKNFWDIRSPKKFNEVYYESIIKVLEDYTKDIDSNKKIGVNISDDVEIAKFILSIDLEDFKMSLNNKFENVELIEDFDKKYDIIFKVKTDGYRESFGKDPASYKCSITVHDFKNHNEKQYYAWNKYKDSKWKIEIFEDNKPENY